MELVRGWVEPTQGGVGICEVLDREVAGQHHEAVFIDGRDRFVRVRELGVCRMANMPSQQFWAAAVDLRNLGRTFTAYPEERWASAVRDAVVAECADAGDRCFDDVAGADAGQRAGDRSGCPGEDDVARS